MAVLAPDQALIGLGANLGDAEATVRAAALALGELPRTRLMACSGLYRSAPWEAQGPEFINAVALLETRLEPLALLDALQDLEHRFGRERPYPNAPRTLDLDLLMSGSRQLSTPRLTLPHPRMHLRAFVLRPLFDVMPDLLIPGLHPQQPIRAWLTGTSDQAISPLS
ncbi:MAG: 2-amino-4-hydroxy-6-hydroxymethyldihydropteridine diphosphokinase [Ideonella sp. MAG2]|nr:MAG: 2-amino-4-hydroxy-6-hydroxymethyldihydropteridine diphosphokinase [Ideonella sp. MAG2]